MNLTLSLIVLVTISNTSAFAINSDLHSMVVGNKKLELVDATPLTSRADGAVVAAAISPDGRHVALILDDPNSRKVWVMKTSGGSPIVAATGVKMSSDVSDPTKPDGSVMWVIGEKVQWSGDSKSFAVVAEQDTLHTQPQWGGLSVQPFILLYSSTGRQIVSLPVHGEVMSIKVGPTSRQLAAVLQLPCNPNKDPRGVVVTDSEYHLVAYDTVQNTSQTLLKNPKEIELQDWSDTGSSVVYIDSSESCSLQKIWLDGGTEETLMNHFNGLQYSPDLKWRIYADKSGISIENLSTGTRTSITKTDLLHFEAWVPGCNMVVLSSSETITDDGHLRSLTHNRLWLGVNEQHKLNTMLIADDYNGLPITWSTDRLKLAYVSEGKAYLAQLNWSGLEADDKVRAGLPLTEDEEKTLMVENGKQIAVATSMYCDDWDDTYPPNDSFETGLIEYLKANNNSPFNRPGTVTNAFKCLLADGMNEANIENPSDTPLGELDAGYSWKVVVYCDGHVRIVQK